MSLPSRKRLLEVCCCSCGCLWFLLSQVRGQHTLEDLIAIMKKEKDTRALESIFPPPPAAEEAEAPADDA